MGSTPAYLGHSCHFFKWEVSVLSFIDVPEIILKDNGTLFDPELGDARVQHHVVLSSNSNTIRPGHMPAGRKCPPVPQTADR